MTPSVLRDLALCPACRGDLDWLAGLATCIACEHRYEVVDGIPLLIQHPEASRHDELSAEHHGSKGKQSDYFDHVLPTEFEITRPRGTPKLYRWCIDEKFRRSMESLHRAGNSSGVALAVCAGSGMDAEYLAQSGRTVIAADISLGAARRCRERARRYGLALVPIVADVERLPFRDRSIGLVYVHDGLHHLEDPTRGLLEMARVASHSISITEPAAAGVTKLAVRAGLAMEFEEAGNRVVRLQGAEFRRILSGCGFRTVAASRYAMYYRHQPGRVFRMLSKEPAFGSTRLAYRVVNRLFGRFGNKITIQAVRTT